MATPVSMQGVAVSFVVVTHESRDAIARTLPPLVSQLQDGDELVVVDNASRDGTAERARELAPAAKVLDTGANLGFGEACNRGAQAATSELVVFLNPDAIAAPGFREAIARPLTEGRGWSAWQGLVTAESGRLVNSRAGVIHFTGIAWAGGAGEDLDQTATAVPGEPAFVSGACLAAGRSRFLAAGGFAAEFFLYHEDVDLSLRLRLAGERLGVEPSARVDHDYEFDKGPAKWRHLERNRWATLIRTYPTPLLALLAPALLATEMALLAIAVRGGWLAEKLAAWAQTIAAMPRLMRERRAIQAERAIGAGEFARALTPDLDSRHLGAVGRWRPLRSVLRGYWSVVLRLLGEGGAAARRS